MKKLLVVLGIVFFIGQKCCGTSRSEMPDLGEMPELVFGGEAPTSVSDFTNVYIDTYCPITYSVRGDVMDALTKIVFQAHINGRLYALTASQADYFSSAIYLVQAFFDNDPLATTKWVIASMCKYGWGVSQSYVHAYTILSAQKERAFLLRCLMVKGPLFRSIEHALACA